VFVQSDDDFTAQPEVANGASQLLQDLFGDAGKHARAAVGVNALPLNAPVEVEMIFEVRPAI
jgi:enamine deaminase RidA (YjgF/YER057c/UK114 family)